MRLLGGSGGRRQASMWRTSDQQIEGVMLLPHLGCCTGAHRMIQPIMPGDGTCSAGMPSHTRIPIDTLPRCCGWTATVRARTSVSVRLRVKLPALHVRQYAPAAPQP